MNKFKQIHKEQSFKIDGNGLDAIRNALSFYADSKEWQEEYKEFLNSLNSCFLMLFDTDRHNNIIEIKRCKNGGK